MSDGETKEVYCICRKPAGSRFMIECDTCKEWFHGDCVDQSESGAEDIQIYACPGCRKKDKVNNRIKYKKSILDKVVKLKTIADLNEYDICFGPGCTNRRKGQSKYCSKRCGHALARKRVENLLPFIEEQIKQHTQGGLRTNAIPVSKLNEEKCKLHDQLKSIESKLDTLSRVLDAVDNFRENSFAPAKTEDEDDKKEDHFAFCFVCGANVARSIFTRHVELCYRRIERNLSFESLSRSNLKSKHKLFCDEQDPKTKKYCKRLWVSCADHTKKPKANDEICAFPIADINKSESTLKLQNLLFDPVTISSLEQPQTKRKNQTTHSNTSLNIHTYKKEELNDQSNIPYNTALPLSDDEEDDDSFGVLQFCPLTKKNCHEHFNWETSIRSSLDIERVRIYSKLDSIEVKLRRLTTQSYNRYNMYDIITHKIEHHFQEKKVKIEN